MDIALWSTATDKIIKFAGDGRQERKRYRQKMEECGKFSEQRKIRDKSKKRKIYKFPGPKREAERYNYGIAPWPTLDNAFPREFRERGCKKGAEKHGSMSTSGT